MKWVASIRECDRYSLKVPGLDQCDHLIEETERFLRVQAVVNAHSPVPRIGTRSNPTPSIARLMVGRDVEGSTRSVRSAGGIRPHRRDHGGKIARESRRVGSIELHTG